MKGIRKFFASVFVGVLVFSAGVGIVSAANTTNRGFSLEDVGTMATAIDRTQKTDASPAYLRLDEQATEQTHCYVSAYGCNSDGTGAVNLTFVNGSVVSDVVCRKGIQYSVHTKIYEDGYRYAFLTFSQLNYHMTGDISGVWSADSTYRYTDAT